MRGRTMANTMSVERHDPQSHTAWRDHIARYGYVIVHNALPEQNLRATIDDIWRHTGADPNDSQTWYRRDIIRPVGMVEMYQYQSMWNNRQHPHLYEIFQAIHVTDHLSVSIELVGLILSVNLVLTYNDHKGRIN